MDTGQRSVSQVLGDMYVLIHTYKGNFSQFELVNMVAKLHNLESELATMKKEPGLEWPAVRRFLLRQGLANWLNEDLDILTGVLGSSFLDKGNTIEIEVDKLREIEKHIQAVFTLEESKYLLVRLRKLRYESFKELLRSYPDYVEKLAQRLEKSIYPLEITGGDFPVDPDHYHNFVKSLVHIFRNTLDHGIELPEERMDVGKEEFGTVHCSVELVNRYVYLTISDDGRGLDLEKIKEQAVKVGICSAESVNSLTDEEVAQLIFADGLTTTETVTDLSGRGVGLKAVSNEIAALQGRIEIGMHSDEGTTFRFFIPYQEIDDEEA